MDNFERDRMELGDQISENPSRISNVCIKMRNQKGAGTNRAPRSFLFSTFLKTVSAKVLQDIIFYVRRRLPYSGPIPRIDLSQGPISHQLALSWLPVIHIFSELTYLYGLGALVCVGLQIHNPSDWPELFGDLSEAYTVGQAWSRTWHQTLRVSSR